MYMKKYMGALVFLLLGQVLFSALFGGQPVAAVDNFTITNFEVEMELGRDSEGRSTLRTIETITADFPELQTFCQPVSSLVVSEKAHAIEHRVINRTICHVSSDFFII